MRQPEEGCARTNNNLCAAAKRARDGPSSSATNTGRATPSERASECDRARIRPRAGCARSCGVRRRTETRRDDAPSALLSSRERRARRVATASGGDATLVMAMRMQTAKTKPHLKRDRDTRASAPRRRHDAVRACGASAAVGRGLGAARARERLGERRADEHRDPVLPRVGGARGRVVDGAVAGGGWRQGLQAGLRGRRQRTEGGGREQPTRAGGVGLDGGGRAAEEERRGVCSQRLTSAE